MNPEGTAECSPPCARCSHPKSAHSIFWGVQLQDLSTYGGARCNQCDCMTYIEKYEERTGPRVL
jgi:hypothetical protein